MSRQTTVMTDQDLEQLEQALRRATVVWVAGRDVQPALQVQPAILLALLAERRLLKDVLQQVQWADEGGCGLCGRLPDTHEDACPIGRALSGEGRAG